MVDFMWKSPVNHQCRWKDEPFDHYSSAQAMVFVCGPPGLADAAKALVCCSFVLGAVLFATFPATGWVDV